MRENFFSTYKHMLVILLMTCILLLALSVSSWAADGSLFEGTITVGDNEIACRYRVLSEADATVQIGGGSSSAISKEATGELVIPETVELGGKTYAVTIVGSYAFYDCTNLTGTLTIPGSVQSIEDRAFYKCSGFTGLIIDAPLTIIKDATFYYCTGLTGTLNIPETVTEIGPAAFGYTNFTGTLTIPGSVSKIGGEAFSHCRGFTGTLTIPDSVTSIGGIAFDECTGFNGQLILSSNLTTIGQSAFKNCSGFTGDLIIPDPVTLIGSSAFDGCIGFDGSLDLGNVQTIGNSAFSNCKNLSGTLVIPGSVTSMGEFAFNSCLKFRSLVIEPGIQAIPKGAFNHAKFVGSLTIPDTVTSIGDYGFMYCNFDGTLTLPNNLISIGESAFNSGFTGPVTIPASVTTMKNNAITSKLLDWVKFLGDAPDNVVGQPLAADATYPIFYPAGSGASFATDFWDSLYHGRLYPDTYSMAEKPNATYDAAGPTLSGVDDNMKYRTTNGIWIDVPAGATSVTYSVTSATTIEVVRKGNGSMILDSPPQRIKLTQMERPAAGSIVGTNCTNVLNNDGKITGVTDSMEYRRFLGSPGWTSVPEGVTELTGLTNDTYYIRVKGYGTVAPSDQIIITIAGFSGTKEVKPEAAFTATGRDSGILSNVEIGMKYSLDGGSTWNTVTDSTMNITGVTTAKGIKVKTPGNGINTVDSDVQTITVTKAAKPTATFTATGPDRGTLSGVSDDMKYQINSGEWINIDGSTVALTGLDVCTLSVVRNGGATVLESDAQTINITKAVTPSTSFSLSGANANKLTGTTTKMQYSLDGGSSWVNCSVGSTDLNSLVASITETSDIKIKNLGADTTVLESDVQTIDITKADTPTTAGKVDCTTLANNNGKLTGVTVAMEYKSSAGSAWISGNGYDITGLADGTYLVRVKAAGTVLASEYQTLIINAFEGTKEATPIAAFTATGPDSGTISGMTVGMKYRIDDSGWTNTLSSSDIRLSGLSACTISIVKKGNGTTTFDSDEQVITITQAATPAIVVKVDCTTFANNDGKLIGVTADMEYKPSAGGTWTDGTGSDITGLANGTYLVRVKAAGTVLASENQTLIINAFEGTKENTPTTTFSFSGENANKLEGTTARMQYSLDGGSTWVNCSAGSTDLSSVVVSITETNDIKVKCLGNGTTTLESDIQIIDITKAPTPTTAGKVDCTTLANNNGKLTGVTVAMEYKSSAGSAWISGNGYDITGLANGTYLVRVKAAETALASANQTIVIERFTGTKEDMPAATFTATGPDSGTLSGVNSSMKYQISCGEWVNIDGNTVTLTELSACTISLIKKGNETTTLDSEAQTITISKAETPSLTATQPGVIGGEGSIPMTDVHEYSLDSGSTWISAAGETSLPAGTYYVRVKAEGTLLASDYQTITIEAFRSSGGGSNTPTAPVSEIKSGETVTVANLARLVSGGKPLTVAGDNGTNMVFDTDALKGISSQASGDIKVEIKDVSEEHQESLPDKMILSLTVSSGRNAISNFGGKVTVSLPYELKDGERAEDVTVWHLASDGTMTEIPCAYDPVTKLATFKVTHLSHYVVGVADMKPWVNPFTDVTEKDWFYSAVEFCNRNGLFAGTGTDTFSPNSPMTRAMLWTVLGRLDGQSLSGSGVYDAARNWAMEAGITDGTDPSGNITREQMVAILWRYAGSPKVTGDLSKFPDAGNVANYATDAIAWAVENNIIAGTNGSLMPRDKAARAQVAAILQRFIEAREK